MPKSSSDRPAPSSRDAGQHLRGVFRVLHHQDFGDLELQRAARERGADEHRLDVVDEIVAQQLARRDVDAGEERLARRAHACQCGELARGAVEDEEAERRRSGRISSAIGMKSLGEMRPSFG